jgi:hypothetical protein
MGGVSVDERFRRLFLLAFIEEHFVQCVEIKLFKSIWLVGQRMSGC